MPQLVKGGKYVFGWTTINNDLRIRVPDEAFDEYKLYKTNKLIIISGSKPSGGFSINSPDSIFHSEFSNSILSALGYIREMDKFNSNKLKVVKLGERLITWTDLDIDRYFVLSDTFLDKMDLNTGQRLLVIRGSGLGPALITQGIIFNEALKHEDIIEFS